MTTKKPKKPELVGFNLPKPTKAKAATTQRLVNPPESSPLRRAEGGKRLVVYLPPKLAHEFRVKCAELECSHSHAMTEAVDDWIGKKSKRPKY